MKTLRLALALAFMIVLVFSLASQALAQLVVSPASLDFGDVEVGSSANGMVTVMNVGSVTVPLTAEISGNTDFAITSNVPESIGPYGLVDIAVTFSPTEEGLVAANLLINGAVGSTLSGTGVAAEPPPSESIADILAFIDASVADGSLNGSGPGNSADGRRNALRNMIEAAGDLIEDGLIAEACQQLMDAYQRTDGLDRPPDFVAGPAAPTLAGMILQLMASLGC